MPDTDLRAAEGRSKRERVAVSQDLARTATAEAVALTDAGQRRAAELVIVHAYHDGARAMDLLDHYHAHRAAQEGATL